MILNRLAARFKADPPSISDQNITSVLYQLDEFISILDAAIKDAAQKAGYHLTSVDSKNSVELQRRQVESAHNRGEKGILINLVDPRDPSEILKTAGNMKVVLVNRAPGDMGILNENVIYVGSNEMTAGKLQGEWLASYFKAKNKNKIKYILLQGTPGLPLTIQRTNSVLQALADGGIAPTEAAPPVVANFDQNEAILKILPILRSGVQFDAIISNNDAMALGAIKALEYEDINPSTLPIVGIDATPAAIQALLKGKLAMTVFQNATAQGTTAITALTNMLKGNPINLGTDYNVSAENQYAIFIPFELVTKQHIPSDINLSITTG
jgi:inositol transport system substrate-binding protein